MKVKLIRGCSSKGLIEGMDHCGDKECGQCNKMLGIFKEEVERQLKEK